MDALNTVNGDKHKFSSLNKDTESDWKSCIFIGEFTYNELRNELN